MIHTLKIMGIILVLVVLYLSFFDKTVLHMAGLRTVEKLTSLHALAPKPTLSEKSEEAKQRQAGYQWAEDNDITDKNKCQNENASFVSGCKAYVFDNGEDALQDQDSALDQ